MTENAVAEIAAALRRGELPRRYIVLREGFRSG